MADLWKTEYHVVNTVENDTVAWLNEDQRDEAIRQAKELSEAGDEHNVVEAKYYNTEYTTVWEPDDEEE